MGLCGNLSLTPIANFGSGKLGRDPGSTVGLYSVIKSPQAQARKGNLRTDTSITTT